ncbi:hypothetical protein D9M68_804160 [compost metagenome]
MLVSLADNLPLAMANKTPVLCGSENAQYTILLLAKSGASVTSNKPPCPEASTLGSPLIFLFNFPSGDKMTISPSFCVIKNLLSGMIATAHGRSSLSLITLI